MQNKYTLQTILCFHIYTFHETPQLDLPKVQSCEWLLPIDGGKIKTVDAGHVFQLTSDKTILYLNDEVGLRELNTSAVLQLKATASLTTTSEEDAESPTQNFPDVLLSLNVTFYPFQNDGCEIHHDLNCAEFSLEAECNSSCSLDSGGSTSCQWVPEG